MEVLILDRGTNKTSNLSKGGLFTALGVIFVYLSSIVPVNKLYLLGIASSIIPLSVVTTNIKNTLIVYFATSVICLFVSGSKITVISYIIFFGLYGIIKYYIERIRKIYIEFILKLAFFNVVVLIIFYAYKAFFPGIISVNMPLYILIAGSEIVFLIYDYALSLFISYTNRYLHKKI
ncbi:hypothetical protein I6U51_14990 [Clostridium aciditolerans]|uniref:Uncharacterized protein n=1 Tax=Clostridium aciditolerans TaxID=339861 RepID=A0A934M7H8_9CLOT|nr:hypothetical protein [Clostridium aciditolerans]